MIYLQHFKTLIDYNIYKNSYEFVLPNVSSCEEDLDFIAYNPEDEESGSGSGSGSGSEGGPSEPVLEENQVLCKYNVTSTANPTTLLYNKSDTSIFSSMIVDDVEQEVTNEYIFDTEGEHTVLFTLTEGVTSIGSDTFQYCSGLISVTIGNSVTSIGIFAFSSCSGLTNIICNATTAPTIQSNTFMSIKTGGTLTVPAGSTGYDVWMGTGNYYLGKYNWTKVEQ